MEWGGLWTIKKRKIIKQYLEIYATALKNKNYNKWYIDAFAGSGYHSPVPQNNRPSLFDIELPEEREELFYSTAFLALKVNPSFDKYIFIEIDKKNIDDLRNVCDQYNHLNIDYMNMDVNEAIVILCELLKKKELIYTRAVMFLDPFGMQVK